MIYRRPRDFDDAMTMLRALCAASRAAPPGDASEQVRAAVVALLKSNWFEDALHPLYDANIVVQMITHSLVPLLQEYILEPDVLRGNVHATSAPQALRRGERFDKTRAELGRACVASRARGLATETPRFVAMRDAMERYCDAEDVQAALRMLATSTKAARTAIDLMTSRITAASRTPISSRGRRARGLALRDGGGGAGEQVPSMRRRRRAARAVRANATRAATWGAESPRRWAARLARRVDGRALKIHRARSDNRAWSSDRRFCSLQKRGGQKSDAYTGGTTPRPTRASARVPVRSARASATRNAASTSLSVSSREAGKAKPYAYATPNRSGPRRATRGAAAAAALMACEAGGGNGRRDGRRMGGGMGGGMGVPPPLQLRCRSRRRSRRAHAARRTSFASVFSAREAAQRRRRQRASASPSRAAASISARCSAITESRTVPCSHQTHVCAPGLWPSGLDRARHNFFVSRRRCARSLPRLHEARPSSTVPRPRSLCSTCE